MVNITGSSPSMIMVPELPTEIWLRIAHYIEGPRLAKLKTLNSCFLHCYMEMRWKRVAIDTLTRCVSTMVHDLERMADPFVARRTKSLTIRLRDFPQSVLTDLLPSLPVLPVLPNIASLNITIAVRPTPSYAATLFQTITSSPMARTVEKLRIAVYADVLGPLVEHYALNAFEKLIALSLDIKLHRTHRWSTEFPIAFSSFLRPLAPTLERLRISDQSEGHDLCPLFDTLSISFPHLNTLIISFYFSKAETFQESHQALLRFLLVHHNNLHHLHLKFSATKPEVDENHVLGTWLTEFVNASQFSSLRTLGIFPSNTPASLSAVLALIRRTAPTLTSLVLYDRFLDYEDTVLVLDALTESDVQDPTTGTMLARNLKNLEMCIHQLSVPFLDLFACRLPHLEKLSLSTLIIVEQSFCDLMEHRQYNPGIADAQDSDILHTWKLQNLSIRSELRKPDKDAERVVVGAIPALARSRT